MIQKGSFEYYKIGNSYEYQKTRYGEKSCLEKKRKNCHLAIVNPPYTLSQALERLRLRTGPTHTCTSFWYLPQSNKHVCPKIYLVIEFFL